MIGYRYSLGRFSDDSSAAAKSIPSFRKASWTTVTIYIQLVLSLLKMNLPLPTQDECSMHLRSNGKSCKRLHSESYSLDEPSLQSAKKQKLSPPAPSQSPSGFWDNLSRVWLTRNALRELDRRNSQRTIVGEEDLLVRRPANDFLHYCSPQQLREIKRYARRGGPDLCEIRGVCSETRLFKLKLSAV